MSTEQETNATSAAGLPKWDVGRIYVQDTRVPELLCRFPSDPVAVLEEVGDREVIIRYAGGRVLVRVRNPEDGVVGTSYLLLLDGFERGMYQI
ncbi:MAG: hypothetical protein CL878_09715 [Dehalococcoidia bacterium]|nr:hypothetical protein [Dehalococcoidia bacterium]